MPSIALECEVSQTLLKIIQCTSIRQLIHVMDNFFLNIGIIRYNYTHLDEEGRKKHFLFHNNYSQSWIQRYITRHYDTIDPIIFFIKLNNSATTWSNACMIKLKNTYMSKSSKKIFDNMLEAVKLEGLENGIVIPIVSHVYRQHGFYLAFSNKEMLELSSNLSIISAICVALNNKFLQFEYRSNNRDDKTPSFFQESKIIFGDFKEKMIIFTDREQELIRLIYYGKDRRDMAELMNISVNTVDTMTKRIFLKMRVNSKVQLIAKILMQKWHNILL